jgi:hypothetical protein
LVVDDGHQRPAAHKRLATEPSPQVPTLGLGAWPIDVELMNPSADIGHEAAVAGHEHVADQRGGRIEHAANLFVAFHLVELELQPAHATLSIFDQQGRGGQGIQLGRIDARIGVACPVEGHRIADLAGGRFESHAVHAAVGARKDEEFTRPARPALQHVLQRKNLPGYGLVGFFA